MRKHLLAFSIFGLALGLSTASAAPILLYNTGVTANGTPFVGGGLISVNTDDPNWTVATSVAGRGPQAVRASNQPGTWVSTGTDSVWVSPEPDKDQNAGSPQGVYQYSQSFTIGGAFSDVLITGRWAADDTGGTGGDLRGIMINGTLVTGTELPTNSTAYTQFNSFSLQQGVGGAAFNVGGNTITFIVNNTPSGFTPSGLRVEFLSADYTAARTAVPEPATLGLMGAGLGGLLLFKRRRAVR